MKSLHEVQFTKYNEKTVILTENVNGNEEIPENCACLIIVKSESYPDILAHVSVRARNLNVPFVVCFNEDKSNELIKLVNTTVSIKLTSQSVEMIPYIPTENDSLNKEVSSNKKTIQVINTGNKYEKIYLDVKEFNSNAVVAKSNNTMKLYGKVTDCEWLNYPESFAIPFNVMEYFLSLEENKVLQEELDEYLGKISIAK